MSSIMTTMLFQVVSTADNGHCLYGTGSHLAEQAAKETSPSATLLQLNFPPSSWRERLSSSHFSAFSLLFPNIINPDTVTTIVFHSCLFPL
ncbi:hypothetical protein LY78DRAFT_150377 [Colletotrichum sublineola]|nr:hypothetical protein LY78DRAFT_150377 [Colletotrichum sublineola]